MVYWISWAQFTLHGNSSCGRGVKQHGIWRTELFILPWLYLVKCANCQNCHYEILHLLINFSHFGANTQVFLSAARFQTHSWKVYCEAGIVRSTFRFALRASQRCELELNSSDTFLASIQICFEQFQRYTYLDNIRTDRMSRSFEWYLYFVFGWSQVQTRPSHWLSLLRYGLRFLQFLLANSGIR